MKDYQCNSCGKVINNPYKIKITEFYEDYEIDYCGVFPFINKRKAKVHLCENCYKGLHIIAHSEKRMNYDEVRQELRSAKSIVAKIEILYGKNMLNVPKMNDNEILSKMIQIQNLIEQTLSDMEGESTDD